MQLTYVVHCNCLQICCLWIGDHNCDWEWRDSTISELHCIMALAVHCHAVFVRVVQCRSVMSLVAISVRVTVAIPSQPWRSRSAIHTYSSTPRQSIPDSQSYSGNPWSTTDRQPSYRGWPGIVRVTLTVRNTLMRGTWVCIFVTVLALAWIVRVTMDLSYKSFMTVLSLSWIVKVTMDFSDKPWLPCLHWTCVVFVPLDWNTCYPFLLVCMRMCVHVMNMCTYVHMYVCNYVRVYSMYVCLCVHANVYIRLYVRLCTCTYDCMYVCMYVRHGMGGD